MELLVLDVHGGTTIEDIQRIFDLAEIKRNQSKKRVYVFLDEVNACSHMGFISHLITQRSFPDSTRIHDDIFFLAALNPYRRSKASNSYGLVYKRNGFFFLRKGERRNLTTYIQMKTGAHLQAEWHHSFIE